ncbi:MAG: hypothetical protein K2M52_03040, partial [Paramuribaculum sp.]|nr:hypothetical protein [Paramuribaculum sp.]
PLDKEQIIEMVLDLYAARPEAKEYLDFWVSGDIDSKLNKAKAGIIKEISRRQRNRPRPRMTKIKRFIKDIVSLNADSEAVTDIMTFAVERMCSAGSNGWIKDSTQKSTAKLLHDTLAYSRQHGEYATALNRLEAAIADMTADIWWSRDFKKLLADELADTQIAFDSAETTP